MTIDARLSRLLPALTARERAILVHRALRSGEAATELRKVPPEQRNEYNRYMALGFVAAQHFGNLIRVLAYQVETFRFALERMELLDRAATMLEEDHAEDIARERVRAWGRIERAKNKQITVPYFLRSLAEEVREDLYSELCFRWQELRAAELVAGEMAANFDGDDLLEPEARAELDAALDQACALNGRLYAKVRLLPEPTDEFLERSRQLIDHGFAALNLVEI